MDTAGIGAEDPSSALPGEALLPVLQLCDSALPTGAFAHTFGLETYLHRGTVHDEATFGAWLSRFLDAQLVPADGLAVRLAASGCPLVELDAVLYAQALPAQVRRAGVTMGRRLLEIGSLAMPGPRLAAYADLVDAGRCHGHQAIAFGLIGVDHGAPADALVRAFLFSTLTALTQNAVRGVPLGQNAGQRVLARMRPDVDAAARRIATLTLDDLGAVPPGLEIAQMQHETQRARMFMS
ncbi:urease accessory protein UreF [Tersicoccus solisilvae]|uniref:Urease accessory protein UreF n=1 Tax=Tersicoccus solisilvae TaxID=1882339 RepID=A0ABQ1P6K1_9MICC|nr:urease accessory protein UreF [Tersicoccus solisilvae]GGC91798.1 urease accessory protein UreF [Tersicoccus solisilvae]